MSVSFTTYWPSTYVSLVKNAGDAGSALQVVFGGTHVSYPAPSRYGASKGDVIYPVTVIRKVLHVIARLEITEIISIEQYSKDVLRLPRQLCKLDLFDLSEKLFKTHPELGHRIPHDCVYEAVIGNGTPISFNSIVPPEMLNEIRLATRKGEERPVCFVVDGKIQKPLGLLHHCYRLSTQTEKLFSNLVAEGESA
jgi:hypothetical protein